MIEKLPVKHRSFNKVSMSVSKRLLNEYNGVLAIKKSAGLYIKLFS
jgi:hypothetical protein